MKFFMVSALLITSSASAAAVGDVTALEPRVVTGCVCKLRVDGLVVQDTVPMGSGQIARNMRVVNGNNQFCSVGLDRGNQRQCDQIKQLSGPTGAGCPQKFGTLQCVTQST